jgi:hypothetical protein
MFQEIIKCITFCTTGNITLPKRKICKGGHVYHIQTSDYLLNYSFHVTEKNQMGEACSVYGGEGRRIRDFGG